MWSFKSNIFSEGKVFYSEVLVKLNRQVSSTVKGGIWHCIHLLVEKAIAPHSSALAWRIPLAEEPGRLQSMGWLRVGHDWATSLSLFTFMAWRRKWQPTPVFLPGESQGGAWWAAIYGVAQSRTRLKLLSSSSSRVETRIPAWTTPACSGIFCAAVSNPNCPWESLGAL